VSKAVIVAILGIIVAFVPIDGLPDRVSTIITVLAGLSIAVLGVLMRFERLWLIRARLGGHTTDAYAENGAPQQSTE
jgi:predicted tellurium resistance membrane protein TerC